MAKALHQAKAYFTELHDVTCNQKYNRTLPYSFHLTCVTAQVMRFKHLLMGVEENSRVRGKNFWERVAIAEAAAWGHDSIEDARITYNDVKELFNEDVAEIVFLCSEMRGRSRAERKSEEFYEQLKVNELAVYVKLCDIIANTMFGRLTNSGMQEKYQKEYPKVKAHLYTEKFKPLFDELELILNIEIS